MNEIWAIASGTWKRILRMKVVYFLVLCVLVLIASAYNYDILSMEEHKPLMIDVSLVLNTISVMLVAVAITFEIPKELREGVASTLLTKPLGRTQYLVGKWLGTIVTGAVVSVMITIGFFVIFNFAFGERIAAAILQSHMLVMASVIPMAAMAVFFSVVAPEMLAPIVTAVAIWFSFSAYHLGKVALIYGGIIPDLDIFNLKAFAVYGDKMGWEYFGVACLWGVVFSVFALSLTSLIFRTKDIK